MPGLLLAAYPCSAAVYGVPTNLSADGRRCTGPGAPVASCTAASLDPPGYLIQLGINSPNSNGDTTHRMRFFIEVTGTTLDIKVFDPGNNGALDSTGGTGTLTTYELFQPDRTSAGANYRVVSFGNDNATTDNRLARLSFGGAFAAANAGEAFGTGPSVGNNPLAPGLWELRISATNVAGTNFNALGVDVRDAAGNHYNVYTRAGDDDLGQGNAPAALDSALSVGQLSAVAIATRATITEPLVFYPYVTRGCTVETSNYDADFDALARPNMVSLLTDQAEPTPLTTTLTSSGATVQSTNTLTVENTIAPNAESLNYGIWTLTQNTGTEYGINNATDWRVADYRGWADNPVGPPALPRDPNLAADESGLPFGALRMYLPNGYTVTGTPPNTTATATPPLEPTLKTSMRVVSGPNPPTNPGTTRFVITSTVTNVTASALGNVVITTPLASNVAYIAGTQAGYVDGVQPGTLCGDADASNISIATARRCAIGTLAAGSTASMNIEVNFSPVAGPGTQNLTGPPPAAVAGTNVIVQLTRQAVGLARAEFAANPNYVVGQFVTIAGAAQNGYNGLVRATAVFTGGACTAGRFCINYAIPTTGIAAGNDGGAAKTATANAADPECTYAANGPVCAQYTPAFSSAAWPRAAGLGPVCNLVSNVGIGVALLTRASIRGVRVTGSAVEFVTAMQRGSATFNVYAVPEDGAPVRVGSVAAAVADSLQPVFYRVQTSLLPSRRLLIEEIDRHGRRQLMGPFVAGDRRLRAAFERLEAGLGRGGPAEMRGDARRARGLARGTRARSRPDDAEVKRAKKVRPAQDGVKIEVSEPGYVTVALAELQANGLPPNVPWKKVELTNQGRSHEFEWLPGGAIGFLAERLSTDYTGHNVYVVTWGKQAPAMSATLTQSEDPLDPAFVRAERNTIYLASGSPAGDPWFWDFLWGDGSAWPYPGSDGSFDLPGLVPAAGPVPVRLRVYAWSAGAHALDAWINGAVVEGELSFDGQGFRTLEGTVDGSLLRAAGNQLALRYRAFSAGDEGLYFNHVELGVSASPGAGRVARVAPFDLGPPAAVRKAEYLIVTHPLFREQAERLAEQKRREGLKSEVVDVEDAYDGYSAGIVEPNAIRALIQDAYGGGRLRYVLLFGGDTFDSHDYLGTGARSLVPSLLSWDGEFGRIPSENLYADVDGDGAPDVAIGRLPASTLAEAQALVDKLERQSASVAASAGRHLVAVDNQAPGDISFLAQAQRAIAGLPAGSSVALSDVAEGVDAARERLFAGLRQGALATHYFGHGGPQAWADESLLTVDDVPGLAGTPETLLLGWTCDMQWYLSIDDDSLGEAMLLLPRGGAVASFGPAGITDAGLQPLLFEPLYRHLFRSGLPLGVAIQRAKRDALAAGPRGGLLANGWNLLGDPALRLR